ncbi:MAG: MBL fold metallo-hydrolase [Gammaproteobacteria bacterium]|nr:MBL fold metallo-hydrolase [Gammaproteobacteria bacterium]
MRWWIWLLVVVGAAGLILGGLIFRTAYRLDVEQLSDDLYVLYGAGGNVGVLATGEGTVIVDTMTLAYQGSRIREVAAELTGEPVVMIINTHYHLDHTHGNPAFPKGTPSRLYRADTAAPRNARWRILQW